MKKPQKSLVAWTKQKWRTKSGKPSSETGERYLPEKAIKSLTSAEYAATTRAKKKVQPQVNNLSNNPNQLQKRLHDFAEECNIKLMREDIPDWESRVELLQFIIGQKYAASTHWTSNRSTR